MRKCHARFGSGRAVGDRRPDHNLGGGFQVMCPMRPDCEPLHALDAKSIVKDEICCPFTTLAN